MLFVTLVLLEVRRERVGVVMGGLSLGLEGVGMLLCYYERRSDVEEFRSVVHGAFKGNVKEALEWSCCVLDYSIRYSYLLLHVLFPVCTFPRIGIGVLHVFSPVRR